MNRLIKTIKAYLKGIDIDKVISDRNHWHKQYDIYYKKCERLKKELKKVKKND